MRIAYLLSGDENRATELAASALTEFLASPPEDSESLAQLLALNLARQYARNPTRSSWFNRPDSAGINVDDDRSRTKVALDRLDPHQRSTLILSHFAGISDTQIQKTLGVDGHRDQQNLRENAHARVALSAGRASDAPIIDLLNRLAVDAPSADLWPDLEAPLQRIWSARRRSERLLTIGVVAGVLLVLAGGVLWLSGFRPGNNDSGSGNSEIDPAFLRTPIDEPIPTPTEALAAFAAAPTLPMPSGSIVTVQDLQLLRVFEWAGEERSALVTYDPETNTAIPLLTAGGPPLISPDGSWIVSDRNLTDSPGMALLACGSLDGSTNWELQLATPRAMAIGNARIYAMNLQTPDRYQIQVIDLTSGEILDSWPVTQQEVTPATLRAAKLILSETDDQLALLSARVDQAQNRWLRNLAIFRPATGELLDDVELDEPRTDGSTDFDVDNSRPLPGENVLYSVVEDEYTSHVRLQFLDLGSGTLSSLVLPLEARSVLVAERLDENEIFVAPSNTGAVLYVFQIPPT